MVIIYIKFKGLTRRLLHTKFQGSQLSGSGEEVLKFYLIYMWSWWPSWSCYLDKKNIKFLFPYARRLHMKFNSNWSSSFGGKPFENVDRQLTCDLWPSSPNNLDL